MSSLHTQFRHNTSVTFSTTTTFAGVLLIALIIDWYMHWCFHSHTFIVCILEWKSVQEKGGQLIQFEYIGDSTTVTMSTITIFIIVALLLPRLKVKHFDI